MRSILALLVLTLLSAGCFSKVEEISYDSARSGLPELPAVEVAPDDWPWWRGPNRNGHARGAMPPLDWSEQEKVLWSVDVPGRGHASPILWGERVFVATADRAAQTQSLVAYERATGDQLWNTVVHSGDLPPIHSKNSHASATPACDGERVFTVFAQNGAVRVTALDLEGEILWQTEAGPFGARHGYGSSPCIYRSTVIVAGENEGASFLAALHRETGDIVWRVSRQRGGSYGTPIVLDVAGREQLLISGKEQVSSYDPETGALLWYCDGPAEVTANTCAAAGDYVIASGGYGGQAVMCIKADGRGDVTSSHIVWEHKKKAYVPSPLIVGEHVFVVHDDGIATCFDLDSGDEVWQKRLGGSFSSSPVVIDDAIVAANERGTAYVFQAAGKYKSLGKNSVGGDRILSTPTICGGRIYLRTESALFCIGETENETAAPSSKTAGSP